MTQIFQGPRNLREIVVGEIKTGQGRHGGNLRWNALQTVARQIENCHLRQKSKTAGQALRRLQERVEKCVVNCNSSPLSYCEPG